MSTYLIAFVGAGCSLTVLLLAAKHKEDVLACLLVPLIFFSGVLGVWVPDHLVTSYVLALLLISASSRRGLALIALVLLVSMLTVSASLLPDFERQVRFLLLYPLAFLAGAYLRPPTEMWLSRSLVFWSLASSVLAWVERAKHEWLFVRPDYPGLLLRGDDLRGIVGAEHPLTLAVLVVSGIPILLSWRLSAWAKATMLAVMVSGVFATGSRGALLLVAVAVLVAALVALSKSKAPRYLSIVASSIVVLLMGWLVFFSTDETGTRSLQNTTSEGASVEYRLRLYQILGESLVERPFGWGWQGLPEGRYVLQSVFGPRDLALTVDSEIALLVFDAGWLGIALLLGAIWVVLRRGGLGRRENQVAALLLASGAYLALHSWSGLGVAVMLFVGMASRTTDSGEPAECHGLVRERHTRMVGGGSRQSR